MREAANAKHNLEEIRVEQEFQEWWDKESSRVMQQAEAEAALLQENKPASGRMRGAKGKKKGVPEETPSTNGSSMQAEGQENLGAGRHRDRRGHQQKRPNMRGGRARGGGGQGEQG